MRNRIIGWTYEFPEEVGKYWLYGDPFQGLMGSDYNADSVIKPELYLVTVIKISNGFLATTKGQMISSTAFDKEKRIAGWVGYWKKVKLPELPDDTHGYFK
jgi:hypothetical protein